MRQHTSEEFLSKMAQQLVSNVSALLSAKIQFLDTKIWEELHLRFTNFLQQNSQPRKKNHDVENIYNNLKSLDYSAS